MKSTFVKIQNSLFMRLSSIRIWFNNFRADHPYRFRGTALFSMFIILTVFFRIFVTDYFVRRREDVLAKDSTDYEEIESVSIEEIYSSGNAGKVKGVYSKQSNSYISSDVGLVDLRVLTLEDYFNHYGSELVNYADDFIKACEKYNVENWQLMPAIAIAETNGCQTGISYKQKNCWGWGGAGKNRVVFDNFEQAIDRITFKMIEGYGNERMNAKDIQSTYCGIKCMDWGGWKWAKGVNYYVYRINDFGEKYGLERTNEIVDFED